MSAAPRPNKDPDKAVAASRPSIKVDYRYYKTFSGSTIDANGNELQNSIDYYVRCLDQPSTFALSGTHYVLEHNHLSKEVSLGGGELLAFECVPFKQALSELLQLDAHRWLIGVILPKSK